MRSNQISETNALTAFDHRIRALEDNNGLTRIWEMLSWTVFPNTQSNLKQENNFHQQFLEYEQSNNKCCKVSPLSKQRGQVEGDKHLFRIYAEV